MEKRVVPLTRPKTACYARGLSLRRAKVAELADAPDLGSGGREALGVRLPPYAEALARAHPPSSAASPHEDRIRRCQRNAQEPRGRDREQNGRRGNRPRGPRLHQGGADTRLPPRQSARAGSQAAV